MSFQRERVALLRNKTHNGKSLHHEKSTDSIHQSTVPPWLLPVLAALSMVVFLAVSFSLHHKRFVRQQRRLSQYYTLRYHRVAGPILNCSPQAGDVHTATPDKENEQTDKLTRLTRSLSLKFKLNRYNTWSPQVFKNRLSGHCRTNRGCESARGEDDPRVLAQLNSLASGDNRKIVSRHGSLLPGHLSLTNLELLNLADLSGLTRSYSCRSRAIGVTTLSGTLAVAKYKRDSPILSSRGNSGATHCASLTETNKLTVSQFRPSGSSYDADCSDGFHNRKPRSRRGSSLPRYLEDDSFTSLANAKGNAKGMCCSSLRDTSHAGSDNVFITSPHVGFDESDPPVGFDESYPDVFSLTRVHNHHPVPGPDI